MRLRLASAHMSTKLVLNMFNLIKVLRTLGVNQGHWFHFFREHSVSISQCASELIYPLSHYSLWRQWLCSRCKPSSDFLQKIPWRFNILETVLRWITLPWRPIVWFAVIATTVNLFASDVTVWTPVDVGLSQMVVQVLGDHLWTLFGDDIKQSTYRARVNVKTSSYFQLTDACLHHTNACFRKTLSNAASFNFVSIVSALATNIGLFHDGKNGFYLFLCSATYIV